MIYCNWQPFQCHTGQQMTSVSLKPSQKHLHSDQAASNRTTWDAYDVKLLVIATGRMDPFNSDHFRSQRHNSLYSWQQGGRDNSSHDHHHVIAGLFEAISKLLIIITRLVTTSAQEFRLPTRASAGERMKNEAERFYLWGFDMSISNGLFDTAVSHQVEGRNAIVRTLFGLANVLLLAAGQDPLQSYSSCQVATRELMHVLRQMGHDPMEFFELDTHLGAEDEEGDENDLDDLPDEVDTYIDCLLDISMAMGDLFGDSIQSPMDMVDGSIDVYGTEVSECREEYTTQRLTSVQLPPPVKVSFLDSFSFGAVAKDNPNEPWQALELGAINEHSKPQQRSATWHTSREEREVHEGSDELRARQCISIRIAEIRESLNITDNDRLAGAWKARGARSVKTKAKHEPQILHPLMSGSHNVPVEYNSTQASSSHWMVRMLRKPTKVTIPVAIVVGAIQQRRSVRVQR